VEVEVEVEVEVASSSSLHPRNKSNVAAA
jgi:hypothetical protein